LVAIRTFDLLGCEFEFLHLSTPKITHFFTLNYFLKKTSHPFSQGPGNATVCTLGDEHQVIVAHERAAPHGRPRQNFGLVVVG